MSLSKEIESAAEGFHAKEPKSSQYYQVVFITYFNNKLFYDAFFVVNIL